MVTMLSITSYKSTIMVTKLCVTSYEVAIVVTMLPMTSHEGAIRDIMIPYEGTMMVMKLYVSPYTKIMDLPLKMLVGMRRKFTFTQHCNPLNTLLHNVGLP
jgi:hypothetical protein